MCAAVVMFGVSRSMAASRRARKFEMSASPAAIVSMWALSAELTVDLT